MPSRRGGSIRELSFLLGVAWPFQLAVPRGTVRVAYQPNRRAASRRQTLLDGLAQAGSESLKVEATAGLAVIVSITALARQMVCDRRYNYRSE
jgi:hypothetical protein